jgi:ribosomal protein L37AE/L43A
MWFLREGQDVAVVAYGPERVTCPVCGRDSLVGEFNSLDIWGCEHAVDVVGIPGRGAVVVFNPDP